jgi:hypothetical protein
MSELRDNATYDYERRIDDALRGVVRDVLADVALHGLQGDHHFYLSFRTDFPDVAVSPALRERYPEEITVVLQHQFWNLTTDECGFAVTLRFGGVEERVSVPWPALTVFADPSAEFGLQLRHAEETVPVLTSASVEAAGGEAQVVQLDDFRR